MYLKRNTYLTCSVTFEENTCILTFCMYFDMTHARPHDNQNRGRLNSRSPGANRSPRPTQKRPPPVDVVLLRGLEEGHD